MYNPFLNPQQATPVGSLSVSRCPRWGFGPYFVCIGVWFDYSYVNTENISKNIPETTKNRDKQRTPFQLLANSLLCERIKSVFCHFPPPQLLSAPPPKNWGNPDPTSFCKFGTKRHILVDIPYKMQHFTAFLPFKRYEELKPTLSADNFVPLHHHNSTLDFSSYLSRHTAGSAFVFVWAKLSHFFTVTCVQKRSCL
jgi:hypothetical protein